MIDYKTNSNQIGQEKILDLNTYHVGVNLTMLT
jgi:hypothetical protein